MTAPPRHIFGFDATDQLLFNFEARSKFDSYPALAPDGTLLVGANDGILSAFR